MSCFFVHFFPKNIDFLSIMYYFIWLNACTVIRFDLLLIYIFNKEGKYEKIRKSDDGW